jgi:hypothetical protein
MSGLAGAAGTMSSRFSYLIPKLEAAPLLETPFPHVEIQGFLAARDFEQLVNHPQIRLGPKRRTEALLTALAASGYAPIEFPGAITSAADYLDWLAGHSDRRPHATTEGFGMVYRLQRPEGLIEELQAFLHSDAFTNCLTKKFGISRPVTPEIGVQKYLHGYEISPHPDIRRKALTFMLNANSEPGSETEEIHTRYLVLKDKWRFIGRFWKRYPQLDRSWLPWDWCETSKEQRSNNSIVIFSPANDTLHAIRADYDHLGFQRTQVYGNLWYGGDHPPLYDSAHFRWPAPVREALAWRMIAAQKARSTAACRRMRGSRLGEKLHALRRGRAAPDG